MPIIIKALADDKTRNKWHERLWQAMEDDGVEALLALGRKAEAVQYAEASRGLNQADSVIDQACEEILIDSVRPA